LVLDFNPPLSEDVTQRAWNRAHTEGVKKKKDEENKKKAKKAKRKEEHKKHRKM
jgi:hypothetical protein